MERERVERRAVRPAIVAVVVVAFAFGGSRARGAYQTLMDNGPSSNRVDIVFLGDGYTVSDIAGDTYTNHISETLDRMFDSGEEPFSRYQSFFNVYRIDVVSNESGADVPPEGIYRDTALDARYYFDGVTERLLSVNTTKATAALSAELSGSGLWPEIKLVTVNDTRYGGSGGSYAVYSGGNSSGPHVALHEVAHSFAGLADEYYTSGTTHSGPEPAEVNVTKNSNPATVKWSDWIGYEDPDHPEMGAIGVYEGAEYYEYGLYRPSMDSKMRSVTRPFDAVSREQLILTIFAYVDPLDGWLENAGTLVDPDELWVDVVDPAVIDVQWYVDDILIDGAEGETFDMADYGFGLGEYEVKALAYDGMISDWILHDLDDVQQSVLWDVQIISAPPIIGDADASGYVDDDDLSLLLSNWNQAVGWSGGDFSGDGFVDDDDLSLLLSHWGAGIPAMNGSAAPEPATVVLMLCGGISLLRRKPPRRRMGVT